MCVIKHHLESTGVPILYPFCMCVVVDVNTFIITRAHAWACGCACFSLMERRMFTRLRSGLRSPAETMRLQRGVCLCVSLLKQQETRKPSPLTHFSQVPRMISLIDSIHFTFLKLLARFHVVLHSSSSTCSSLPIFLQKLKEKKACAEMKWGFSVQACCGVKMKSSSPVDLNEDKRSKKQMAGCCSRMSLFFFPPSLYLSLPSFRVATWSQVTVVWTTRSSSEKLPAF